MSQIVNTWTRPLLLLLLALSLTALPAAAQDSSSTIRTMLEERDEEIKALLGSKDTFTDRQREQLKTLINGVIDFEAMSRTALGPHWDDLTPEQRAEFVDVFGDIVRSQSLSNLDIYRSKVSYESIDVEGSTARAATSVVYKDVETEVVYVLSYRDGAWKVDDIVLDEVSTTQGYARSFQSVVRKRGFDSLMKSLHKKLEKVQAGA